MAEGRARRRPSTMPPEGSMNLEDLDTMGTTRTPTYRAEVYDQSGRHLQLWDVKRHGRPTAENAEKLRRSLNDSFQPGGVNAHIRIRFGKVEAIPHVNRVLVVRQRDGVAVAAARMPAFEVI